MVYWIWLTQIKGIGPVLQKRLLNHFKNVESIYNADKEDLLSIEGIGPSLVENISGSRCLDKSNSILDQVNKQNIKLLTFDDPLYLNLAKEPNDSPILLYYKGNIREDLKGIAIVGSRRCSEYGKQVTIETAKYLAKNDVPVISGMAKGIDSYAHTACLKEGGYTLAFLGNGLDICYPAEHINLMESIIDNGAVISQFPPGTRPRPEYFPKRNALISSWSDKILVTEAAEKSGALITAEIGKKYGREIFVIPHEIYSTTGRGTNNLLDQGAKIYLDPAQLLSSKNILLDNSINENKTKASKNKVTREIESKANNFTDIERKVADIIKDKTMTIEDISKAIKMNEVKLLSHLSIMEIKGILKGSPGGKFKLAVTVV